MTESRVQDAPDHGGANRARDIAMTIRAEIEKLRPYIQADGGDIEFVEYDEGTVTVRLMGACSSCPSSILTLKAGVEARIRELVPEVEEVVTI